MSIAAARQKVIPAVVYLEMARAAVDDATSSLSGALQAGKTVQLFDIAWADPAVFTERQNVSVALFAQRDDQVGYEIYSCSEGYTEEVIHCQGQAFLSSALVPVKLDLAHLKSQMMQGQRASAKHDGVVSQVGMQYGPAYQGVRSVHFGEKQVLAQLAIPGDIADDALVSHEGLVLHPVMMDSVLQAAVDLLLPENQPSLPLALESLSIFSACTTEMFAWIRYSSGANAEHANLLLDIDLCDPQGKVCIQMRGLTYESPSVAVENHAEVNASAAGDAWISPLIREDAGVVLDAPQSEKFISSGAPAKPTQISLAVDG
jgi:hypothetical protein